jgi:predicted membrane channel-forming protein YqfA (hemolysin III family)
MEAVGSSETHAAIYQTAWRYIPDDHNIETMFLVSPLFKLMFSFIINSIMSTDFQKLHKTFRKIDKFNGNVNQITALLKTV